MRLGKTPKNLKLGALLIGTMKMLGKDYKMNARPVVKAPNGHHNCLSTINLPYTERLKAMPFQAQCTAYRGMTFLQSDADRVRPALSATATLMRRTAAIPDFSARREAFHQMLTMACTAYTYVVSYTGQWRHPSFARHIRQFWTHAPGVLPFVIEIKSIGGELFLSIHRSMKEDRYVKAFLDQLEENGISYRVSKSAENDIAEFPMPAAERG